ncbi:putative HTH transcriptional regulator [Bradyrhizobium sp. F1.13.1]
MISKKTAAELIAELNETDETQSLEAKSIAEASVGKSLFETICAMSNEPGLEGGTILLGVEKEELSLFPLFSAIGVKDTDKICSDIASTCATIFNTTVRTRPLRRTHRQNEHR